MLKVFLLFLFFSSCTYKSELIIPTNGAPHFDAQSAKIKRVNEINWDVGKNLATQISKGVIVEVTLPIFTSNSLQVLKDKERVDSWLIKVMKKSSDHDYLLGMFYLPFTISSSGKIDQRDYALFHILYGSGQFVPQGSKIKCPDFGHDRKLGQIEINNISQDNALIYLSDADKKIVQEKIETPKWGEVIISAGISMVADYTTQICLFNSKEQLQISSCYTLPQIIRIKKEDRVAIPGCDSYQDPASKFKNESQKDSQSVQGIFTPFSR